MDVFLVTKPTRPIFTAEASLYTTRKQRCPLPAFLDGH
jgi:hypothetical protein